MNRSPLERVHGLHLNRVRGAIATWANTAAPQRRLEQRRSRLAVSAFVVALPLLAKVPPELLAPPPLTKRVHRSCNARYDGGN